MSEPLDWEATLSGLRRGDSEACRDFWRRYGRLLESVADRQMSRRLRRRVGPDDIVQSVFKTIFRRMAHGQFDVPDADALWRLMCSITLTKARRAARDHHRQKRGLQRETHLGDHLPSENGSAWDQFVDHGESPTWAIEWSDELRSLLDQLGEEECHVLDLKWNGLDNEQVAERLGCSERTVRRLVNKIQSKWQAMIDGL